MKTSTKNKVEAGAYLASMALEEGVPGVRIAKKAVRVYKDVYALRTGRRPRLSDLPAGVRALERGR